jgi:hypothetical protein
MVYFQAQIPKFWYILEGNAIEKCCYILWTFGLFYGHLVYFVNIWYIFHVWVPILYQEKSGNPVSKPIKSLDYRDRQRQLSEYRIFDFKVAIRQLESFVIWEGIEVIIQRNKETNNSLFVSTYIRNCIEIC